MVWLKKFDGLFTPRYALNVLTRYEWKLPGKYKGTFIEKWGKDLRLSVNIAPISQVSTSLLRNYEVGTCGGVLFNVYGKFCEDQ
jgi:hypothetical protein